MPSVAHSPSRAARASSRARQAAGAASAPAPGPARRRRARVWSSRRPGAAADPAREPVRGERGQQLVDAASRQRADDDDARRPCPGVLAPQREHVAHLAAGLRRERQVALADREHVGDLERARLDRLHVVAQAGRADDDARVGELDDARLRLPGADRLDDHPLEAAGVEGVDCDARRPRQPAELAARRERADEDVLVGGVGAHADPVAEHGAAADRAGRIDGDDRDPMAFGEPGAEQRVDERRLAAAGHARDADDPGAAGAGGERGGRLGRAGRIVVDQRQQPRQRAPVTGDRAFAQRRRGEGRGHLRRRRAAGRRRGRDAAGRRSPRW